MLSSHWVVKHSLSLYLSLSFLLSLSCTLSYGNQIKIMKLLPTNCDLLSFLWWELTSQWRSGAVGTSCSRCTHLYVSGSAELGVLLGWHTGWWNVRFLIMIKFTKEEIMADVSFCQRWTESLKWAVMGCDVLQTSQSKHRLCEHVKRLKNADHSRTVRNHVVWMLYYQAFLLKCRAWILWIFIAFIRNEKITYSALVKIASAAQLSFCWVFTQRCTFHK